MGLRFKHAQDSYRFNIGAIIYFGLTLGIAVQTVVSLAFFGLTTAAWVPLGLLLALVVPIYLAFLICAYMELKDLRVAMVTAALEDK